MEDGINTEVEKFTSMLDTSFVGTPVDLNSKMNLSIVNALWQLLVGEKFQLDDQRLHHIVNLLNEAVQARGNSSILLNILGPDYVEKYSPEFKAGMKMVNSIAVLVKEHIQIHKKGLEDKDKSPEDFLDMYLEEIRYVLYVLDISGFIGDDHHF